MLSVEAVEGQKRSLHSFLSSHMTGQAATTLVRSVESWSARCCILILIPVGECPTEVISVVLRIEGSRSMRDNVWILDGQCQVLG